MTMKKKKRYIINKKNHIYQSTWFNCWPASLKMILNSLWVYQNISQETISEICKTNYKWTTSENLQNCLIYLRLKSIIISNWTLEDLKFYKSKWYKLMIWHWSWFGLWHYSVIHKIEKNRIFILDPIRWINIDYKLTEFYEEYWNLWNHKEGKRWFVAIKK